jgi:predicted ester cyclase
LVEYQAQPDTFSVYQQLGVLPSPAASTSSSSEYRDQIEHFYQDAIVKGDLTAVDDVLHPDYVYHGFAPIGPGPEGMKTYIRDGLAGASDIEAEIEDFFAEGDRAAARLRIAVSHTGELFGAPATGRRLEVMNHCTYRFKDGKIIEEWDTTEEAKMMTVLGLLPEPPG